MRCLAWLAALSLWTSAPAAAVERPAPLPDPLELPPWAPSDASIATLSNGLEVVIVSDHEAPLVDVRLLVGVGEYADPDDKVGLARAVFELATAGTAQRDADALSSELRRLGAQLEGSLQSGTTGVIRASGLSRNLEPLLDLWAEVITSPIYPEGELNLWKTRQKADIARTDRDPGRIASRTFWHLVYGDGYIGRIETAATLDALTVDDLVATHQERLGPHNALVLVGGDVTRADILPLLEQRLGSWQPTDVQVAPVEPGQRKIRTPTLFLIDHPGATQSHIRVGHTIPPRTDPAYFPLLVANQAFGGAFTSRLNLNLREDKGYTYGASCWLVHLHGNGQFGCSTSVRTDVTGPALQEMAREMQAVLGDRPLSEEEIARAKESLIRQWPMQQETVGAKLDTEVEMWRYGLPEDWQLTYVENLAAVGPEAANQALKDALAAGRTLHMPGAATPSGQGDPDLSVAGGFWLVVGDASKIREDLEPLGLPIVVLDAYAQPIPQPER